MLRRIICFVGVVTSNCCYSQSYDDAIKKAGTFYDSHQADSCAFYFNQAFKIHKPKASDLYNAAVCNTLSGNSRKAFRFLRRAIKGINISKLRIDPDLDFLHDKKGWASLLMKGEKVQRRNSRKVIFPNDARQLSKLWESDQYLRFRLGRAYESHDTVKINEYWKQLKPVDSTNLLQLEEIVDRIGWPTKSKVGSLGASTAFLIIDHSPRETMEKYFPFLEQAAKNGEASMSSYATMKDRILVNRGRNQIYATQKYWDPKENKFVYFPTEDAKNVNARRKEVGLDPLVDFQH